MPSTNQGEFDFVSEYVRFADVLEAPGILHELVAIQLVAATLNRKGVTFRNGTIHYSEDLWMVMLSGSGAGRSTTVGLADPILKYAGMEDLERSVRWGSGPAFYQDMAKNPAGVFIWGEISEQFKMLNQKQFDGVKEWLTDRFDSFRVPPPFTYRSTKKKSDTPPIPFKQPVRVNILGTSSQDWFFRHLAEEDSAGGFMARWMIVRADGEARDVPTPQSLNQDLIEPLAVRLIEINASEGEADLSAVMRFYPSWYGSAKRRFLAQPNRALAEAFWNRHRGNVLKLAVVFEASASATLKVTPRSWIRAVKFAKKVEESVFKILPTGMNSRGYNQQKIEDRIRQGGPDGLSRNDLTRGFQSMDSRERDGQIKTLCEAGRIQSQIRETSGRPSTVYIHEDFRQRADEPS